MKRSSVLKVTAIFWMTFILVFFQNCGRLGEQPGLVTSFSSTVDIASQIAEGKLLYEQNCSSCHDSADNSTKKGRSLDQIKMALQNISAMQTMSFLSRAQLEAISTFLTPPAGPGAGGNPFVCAPDADPAVSQLRRLTRAQYLNSLQDLLAGQVLLTELQTEINLLPTEFLDHHPAIDLFDSMNLAPTNFRLIQAHNNIAGKAADLVISSANKVNALVGSNCMSQSTVADTCINGFLNSFGSRTYRRPLKVDEVSLYRNLFRQGTSNMEGFALVLESLLQAPEFLHMIETDGTEVAGRSDLLALNNFELASRLSYLITSSMPDTALWNAALRGELTNVDNLKAHAARLYQLPRARETIARFYSQWLKVDNISAQSVTPTVANGVNTAQFKVEAQQEILDFMNDLIWNQNGNYQTLMTSNRAFPKGPNLARIYGVPASNSPVSLPAETRSGLLTRAGMLAWSQTGSPDPIKRGVQIRLNLLCDNLGDPPPNTSGAAEAIDPLSSHRSQTAARTSPMACVGCHTQINPLGFALGNYDGLGRFLTIETIFHDGQLRANPIDARVEPNIESSRESQIDGAVELQRRLADSQKGPACLTKQWLQFNVGRKTEAADSCSLATLYDRLTASNGSMLEMFKSLSETKRAPNFLIRNALGSLT